MKNIKRKRTQKLKGRALASLVIALLLSLYLWLVDYANHIAVPDSTTPLQLYSTEAHDDLTVAYRNAIHSAKDSITLIIYTLNDPQIIDALNQKSVEGCRVKVICDAKSKEALELDTLLHKKISILKRFGSGLMHQKILLIDGHTSYIGSANMTRGSLRHYGNLVTAVNSIALGTLIEAKAQSFTPSGRLLALPHHSFHIANQKMELSFLPDDTLAVDRLKALMRSAKKSMRIAMFFWTHQELAREAIKAHQRGVDVSVVIDSNSAIGASAKVFEMLKQNGISVKASGGNALLHHKFMYIDGKTLVNGSANWTLGAFHKNDDCFLILQPLSHEQTQYMDKLWMLIEGAARL